MDRKLVVKLLATLALCTGMSLAQSRPASLDPAAQCYFDALAAQNLDALTNCFASDAVVMDVSRPVRGRAAIRTWARNEVMGGSLRLLETREVRPGHVRTLVHWAPSGSAGWRAWYTFDFRGGKIVRADLQYA